MFLKNLLYTKNKPIEERIIVAMDGFPEKQTKASGFTLIEVLIVMAVITVLYEIRFPIGKRVITRARIEADRI